MILHDFAIYLHESLSASGETARLMPNRCDALVVVRRCAEQGMGVPAMYGKASPSLRQVEAIDTDSSIELCYLLISGVWCVSLLIRLVVPEWLNGT